MPILNSLINISKLDFYREVGRLERCYFEESFLREGIVWRHLFSLLVSTNVKFLNLDVKILFSLSRKQKHRFPFSWAVSQGTTQIPEVLFMVH